MTLRRMITRGLAVAALSTVALTGVSLDNASATKYGKPWRYGTMGYFSSATACRMEMSRQEKLGGVGFDATSGCYQLRDGRWVFNYRYR